MSPPRAQAPQVALDPGILPTFLGYHVRRAQVAIWRDFVRTVARGQIRPALFSVLVLAEANPGIAQIQLAQQLAIDKASVVALIDKLERARLITRRRSTVDRRRQGLFISTLGARRLKVLKRDIARHERRFLDRLNAAEARQLFRLLQRLYD
ncbi:MAG: MarR family winged helix-turn-helix transcriptional regulator [Pseudomonadota bacterium]